MAKVLKPIIDILIKKLEIESERFGEEAFKDGKIVNYNALKRTIIKQCEEYLIFDIGNGKELSINNLHKVAKVNWEELFKRENKKENVIRTNENCLLKHEVKHHVTTDIVSLVKLFGEGNPKKKNKKTEIKNEGQYQNIKTLHTVAWCLEYECWQNLIDNTLEAELPKMKAFYLDKGGYSSLVVEIDRQIEALKDDNQKKILKDGKSKGIESEDNTGKDRIKTKFVVSDKYPTLISKPEEDSNEVITDFEKENKYQILNIIKDSFRLSDYSSTNENDGKEFDLFVINILSKIREDQNSKGHLRDKLLEYLSPVGRQIELEKLFESIIRKDVLGDGTKSEITTFINNNSKRKNRQFEDILIVNALSISLLRKFEKEKADILIKLVNKAIIEENHTARQYALVGLFLGLFKAYNRDETKQKEVIGIIDSLPDDYSVQNVLFLAGVYLIRDKKFIDIDFDYLNKNLLIKDYQWFVPFDIYFPFLKKNIVDKNKQLRKKLFSQILSDTKFSKLLKYDLIIKSPSISESVFQSIYKAHRNKHIKFKNSFELLMEEFIICVNHLYLLNGERIPDKIQKSPIIESFFLTLSKKINKILLIGYYNLTVNNNKKALNYFIKESEINPNSNLANKMLGIANLKLNNLETSLNCFKKAYKLNPYSMGALNNIGIVYNATKKYKEALVCFKKVLKFDSENYKAWCNSSITYFRLNKLKEAIRCNEKALEINPDYYKSHLYLGLIYARKGDYKKAIESYNEAINLTSTNNIVGYNLALAYIRTKDFVKAIEAIHAVLKTNRNDIDIQILKGDVLFRWEKTHLALEQYKNVQSIAPNNSRCLRQIGSCLQILGEYNKAMDFHLEAKDINPDDILNLGLIGKCLRMQGDYTAANDYYLTALEINPEFAWNLMQFALNFQKQGDYIKALKYHRKAENIEPDNVWNLQYISWCYFMIGDLKLAKQYSLKVTLSIKHNEKTLKNLGHFELCNKNIIQAIEYYKQSLDACECDQVFFEVFHDDFQYVHPYDVSQKEYQNIKEELLQYCQDKQDGGSIQ